MQKMDIDLYMPTKLVYGIGKFKQAGEIVKELGKRTLIVTGKIAMEKLGYTENLKNSLEKVGIKAFIYNKISESPICDEIDNAVTIVKENNIDFIIGLGGGSSIDAAKAIAAIAISNRKTKDFVHKKANVDNALPIIAIPTTAGTGSDMNKSAIIRDPENHFKDGIRSNALFPKFAIVDPELTYSLPKKTTADTGFDAMAHAIESFVSPKAHPFTDALALENIKQINHHLPIVINEPKNSESRSMISLQSSVMGFNLSFIGTCFPHRFDKALCAFNPTISHGQYIAMIYPFWAQRAWGGNITKFAQISSLLDPSCQGLSEQQKAERFPQIITDIIRSLNLNMSPSKIGIDELKWPELARKIAGDLTIDPIPIQVEEVPRLIKNFFTQ